MQALAFPEKMGIWQGLYSGFTVGFMNCIFLCAYALALWYGSTRVEAKQYTVRHLSLLEVNGEPWLCLSSRVHVLRDVRAIHVISLFPDCSK